MNRNESLFFIVCLWVYFSIFNMKVQIKSFSLACFSIPNQSFSFSLPKTDQWNKTFYLNFHFLFYVLPPTFCPSGWELPLKALTGLSPCCYESSMFLCLFALNGKMWKMHRRMEPLVSKLTWVIVTWSLKNWRSAIRTSKLALALSRFFCRRPVAWKRNIYFIYIRGKRNKEQK